MVTNRDDEIDSSIPVLVFKPGRLCRLELRIGEERSIKMLAVNPDVPFVAQNRPYALIRRPLSRMAHFIHKEEEHAFRLFRRGCFRVEFGRGGTKKDQEKRGAAKNPRSRSTAGQLESR